MTSPKKTPVDFEGYSGPEDEQPAIPPGTKLMFQIAGFLLVPLLTFLWWWMFV